MRIKENHFRINGFALASLWNRGLKYKRQFAVLRLRQEGEVVKQEFKVKLAVCSFVHQYLGFGEHH